MVRGCTVNSASTELVEIGLLGDEADGAAHRARAVQCALRAAQDLDAVHVVQPDCALSLLAVTTISCSPPELSTAPVVCAEAETARPAPRTVPVPHDNSWLVILWRIPAP